MGLAGRLADWSANESAVSSVGGVCDLFACSLFEALLVGCVRNWGVVSLRVGAKINCDANMPIV